MRTLTQKIKALTYFNGLYNLQKVLLEFLATVTGLETNSVIVGYLEGTSQLGQTVVTFNDVDSNLVITEVEGTGDEEGSFFSILTITNGKFLADKIFPSFSDAQVQILNSNQIRVEKFNTGFYFKIEVYN